VSDAIEHFLREALADMNFPGPIEPNTPLGPAGLDIDSLTRAFLWIRLTDDSGVPMQEGDLDRAGELTFGELVALVDRRIGESRVDETQGR
jgi:acyl carrier protein